VGETQAVTPIIPSKFPPPSPGDLTQENSLALAFSIKQSLFPKGKMVSWNNISLYKGICGGFL
jgi:hypothetical protein